MLPIVGESCIDVQWVPMHGEATAPSRCSVFLTPKSVHLTRHKTQSIRDALAASGRPGWTEPPWRSSHEEVVSARWAGNGRDCLDGAEAPRIDHICWVGEGVGSSGGRRVGGPRRRGDSSWPSLQCGMQAGAGAAIRLFDMALCPP